MQYRLLTSKQDTDLVLEATDNHGNRRFTIYERMSDVVNLCNEQGIEISGTDIVEAW